MAVKDIKTENSLVTKYNKNLTFFNKNIYQLKKHNKEEIFFKEIVPLPLSGGSLPEIVPLHQLRDIHLWCQSESQQSSSSRKAAIFCKAHEKVDK